MPLLSGPARSQTSEVDPCDFTRDVVFTYDQVLDCYESVPFRGDPNDPLCDRDRQIDVFRSTVDGFTNLRGNYEATVGWRERLDEIAATEFPSDYAQFLAFQDLLTDFRDRHWVYLGPACYRDEVFAFIPLDLGSTYTRTRPGRDAEQIIYLEAPLEGLADYYELVFGVDLSQYAGMRLVSIDGQDALEYLRDWGATVLREDANDGINLMSILELHAWSVRGGAMSPFPEASSVSLVLAPRVGPRRTLELQWAFAPQALFGFGGPITSSAADFRDYCYGLWPPKPTWEPELPWRGEQVTVFAPTPGWLHWGVNGWQAPPEEYWPAGSSLWPDGAAIESPLLGPDESGRYSVTLGPFTGPDVDVIDFVLHRADDTWDNNNEANYQIVIAEEPSADLALMQSATDTQMLFEVANRYHEPMLASFDDMARRNRVDALEGSDASGRGGRPHLFRDYSEVPSWQLDRDVTEVVPLSNGARVVQYLDDTVVIQLNYDFVQPWFAEVAAGGDYACENADRLIIDLRNNFGGYTGFLEWLTRYLTPGVSLFDNSLVFRELAVEPALNELRFWADQVPILYWSLRVGPNLSSVRVPALPSGVSASEIFGSAPTARLESYQPRDPDPSQRSASATSDDHLPITPSCE